MIEEEIKKARVDIRQSNYELYSEISEKQAMERRKKQIDIIKETKLQEK